MGYDWDHVHGHGGYPVLHLILFALFVALLIFLAVAIWRSLASRYPSGPSLAPAAAAADALGIVRMRYARGEIGRDEFLQATTDLGGTAPAAAEPHAAEPAVAPPAPAPPAAPADDAPTAT